MTKTLKDFHQERLKTPQKIAVVNLGCVRNTVDSQSIMGSLERKGHRLSPLAGADVAIVNTCAFIEEAKKESIDVILDLISLKKQGKLRKVIVAGCLAQRYGKDLVPELGEVDAFVGVQGLKPRALQTGPSLTPPHYAYLKICESCFNHCSFCIIPKLKGRFVSRTMESILSDVSRLDKEGVRELNIVGQDITAYGLDLYRRKALADLLRKIAARAKGIEWIRLLYAYPAHVTDDLLEVMASEPRICKYIDLPLQHVSDRILKAMGRGMTKAATLRLLEKIRRKVPGVFLRTTFITGFPGETKHDFNELRSFLREHPFERVGVFAYSKEEGTPAATFPGQVPRKIREERARILMEDQETAAAAHQQKMVGRELKILIEERQKDGKNIYVGRSEFDAADVDGVVYVRSSRPLKAGAFVLTRITKAVGHDLEGEIV